MYSVAVRQDIVCRRERKIVGESSQRLGFPLPHILTQAKASTGMDYESAAHLAPTPSYALESSDGESDYEDELPSSSRVTRKPAPAPEVEVTFSGATDKLKARGGGEAVFLVGEAGERMAQGVALPSSGEEEEETVSVLVDGEQVRPCETFVGYNSGTDTSAPETGRLDRHRDRLHPRLSLDGPPARRLVSPRGTRPRALAARQGHRPCLLPPAVLHPAERLDPDSTSGHRTTSSVPRFFSLSLLHRH